MNHSHIAFILDCDVRTVNYWLGKYEMTGSIDDKERSGQPRCTTEEEDAAILALSEFDHHMQPKEIRAELGMMDISIRTVRRRLNENGLTAHVPGHEHHYSDKQLKMRIDFCRVYGVWTNDVWRLVIFGDETSFLLGSHYHRLVQCRKGEAWNPEYIHHCKKHGKKVHAWACFCYNGVGEIELFEENLTSNKIVIDILQKHLFSSADKLNLCFNFYYYEHDNDPKYRRGKIVREWIKNNNVTEIIIPSYSPDLNPIENLFSVWKHRVYDRCPSTVDELKQVIREEWNNFEPSLLNKLVNSMPERCKLIVDNQGHRIGK